MTRSASDAGDLDPPAFYDVSQSAAAAWDVWFSMQAGAQHIERLAQHRLERLVATARARSPFYQRLYRDLPADACRIVQMPVVTKRDLMANFDRVLTDPELSGELVHRFLVDEHRAGQPLLDRYAVWSSSGTTGEPGIFVHDGHALAVYEALEVVRFRRMQSPLALAAAMMARDRYALVGATGGCRCGTAVSADARAISARTRFAGRRARYRARRPPAPSCKRQAATSRGDDRCASAAQIARARQTGSLSLLADNWALHCASIAKRASGYTPRWRSDASSGGC